MADTRANVTHECVGSQFTEYLNQDQVKAALHVAEGVRARRWESSNEHILMTYQQQYTSMDTVFRDIIEKHRFTNVILYSGDADIVCDFLSTQRFLAHHMRYRLKEASRIWKLNGALAGVASRYDNGLRFFTVHGAGLYLLLLLVRLLFPPTNFLNRTHGADAKARAVHSHPQGLAGSGKNSLKE